MNSFVYWKKSVLNNNKEFIKYTQNLYELHKENNYPDFEFRQNINFIPNNFENFEFKHNAYFFNNSKNTDIGSNIPRIYEANVEYSENKLDYYILQDTDDYFIQIQKLLNLHPLIITINKQSPNSLIGVHVDTNRQLMIRANEDFEIEKIRKYILFLTPWYEGQVFLFGRSAYTNWNVGDLIEFKWYIPHATANASNYDRYLMTIFGVHHDS